MITRVVVSKTRECSARANATLPNGTVVPVDSGSEKQIYEYFVDEAEPIDTTNIGWSNDGDYNDYVFRFTGLVCAGAGEACEVDAATLVQA